MNILGFWIYFKWIINMNSFFRFNEVKTFITRSRTLKWKKKEREYFMFRPKTTWWIHREVRWFSSRNRDKVKYLLEEVFPFTLVSFCLYILHNSWDFAAHLFVECYFTFIYTIYHEWQNKTVNFYSSAVEVWTNHQ